jgi:peptide/nickel transport system substrate-binding protein
MNVKSWTARLGLALLAAVAATGVVAQTLRFGLAEDPRRLDPTLARTFVGRIVFASLCDKLVDIDENSISPQPQPPTNGRRITRR